MDNPTPVADPAPLRINLVLPKDSVSGGIRVLAIYAQRLRERGHTVTVIAQPPRRFKLRGRIQHWIKRGFKPPPKQPSYFDEGPVRLRVLDKARPVVDADLPDADVVLATWWETAPWVANLSPSKGHKAYFVQDYGAPGQPLEHLVETWKLPLRLISISSFISGLIKEHTGRDADLITNGVDLDRFHAPPRTKQPTPTVGLVYRIGPNKNLAMTLEALRLARQELPDLRVLGFGPRAPKQHEPEVERGDFLWNASDQQVIDRYRACDAWLFATKREGFGLPVLEAMACRTPVIATPAGAAPELLAGGGGWIVPHDDAKAMAQRIVELAGMTNDAWLGVSDAAHATAQANHWGRATQRLETVLRDTAAGRMMPSGPAVPVANMPPDPSTDAHATPPVPPTTPETAPC
ncbi:MAG: glycosyltransferase family 4 protein [Planctomycetota bacterium]